MSRQQRQTEHPAGKGEVDDDGTPMERFKNLTRRLLTVSNVQVQKERRRYLKRKAPRSRRGEKKSE